MVYLVLVALFSFAVVLLLANLHIIIGYLYRLAWSLLRSFQSC